jgi:hypothetical protein
VRITLDAPATETVTVQATVTAGSATGDIDFKAAKTKTVTFKPGQRQKTIAVPVYPDTEPEGVETVFVTLADPSAGLTIDRAAGTVLIVDDD